MRDGDDDWEARIVAAFHALGRQVERMARNSGEVEAADVAALEERHRQFHHALIAHCRSPRLLELANQLYVETQRYRLPSLVGQVAGAPPRDVAAEHQQIMDAALRRSEDAGRLSRRALPADLRGDRGLDGLSVSGVISAAQFDPIGQAIRNHAPARHSALHRLESITG